MINDKGIIDELRGRIYPIDIILPQPLRLSANDATVTSVSDIKSRTKNDSIVIIKAPELEIFPTVTDSSAVFYYAWRLELDVKQKYEKRRYYVDTENGNILKIENLIKKAGSIAVSVTRKCWPRRQDQNPISYGGFPGVEIKILTHENKPPYATGVTDYDGYYRSPELNYLLYFVRCTKNFNELNNDYIGILNGETVNINSVQDYPSFDFYTSYATDETNVFYHINQMHDYFSSSPLLYNVPYIDVYVHNEGVYPLYDGAIKLGLLAGYEWARCADIIYHEYLHHVIYNLYGGFIENLSTDPAEGAAMEEAFSDYFACAKLNSSTFCEYPPLSEYGSPRLLINDYTYDNFNSLGGPHLRGLIIAGACWELRQALSGTDQLVFEALNELSKDPYHVYTYITFANNLAIVDDNDQVESNGTPHLETIQEKFYGKKIFFTYGPPHSPQNLILAGTTPEHEPILTWTSNVDADFNHYEVWRCINVQGGPPTTFSKIADNLTVTTYTDYGLWVGSGSWKVYYKITAVDNSSYVSNFSNQIEMNSTGFQKNTKPSNEGVAISIYSPSYHSPIALIQYEIPLASYVNIKLYDILGREVETIINEHKESGNYQTFYHPLILTNGIYFCIIRTDYSYTIKKIYFIK